MLFETPAVARRIRCIYESCDCSQSAVFLIHPSLPHSSFFSLFQPSFHFPLLSPPPLSLPPCPARIWEQTGHSRRSVVSPLPFPLPARRGSSPSLPSQPSDILHHPHSIRSSRAYQTPHPSLSEEVGVARDYADTVKCVCSAMHSLAVQIENVDHHAGHCRCSGLEGCAFVCE